MKRITAVLFFLIREYPCHPRTITSAVKFITRIRITKTRKNENTKELGKWFIRVFVLSCFRDEFSCRSHSQDRDIVVYHDHTATSRVLPLLGRADRGVCR